MKTITQELKDHLAGELTTMCTCWKVTRKDGVIYGFTDHVKSLTINGVIYSAKSGYTASSIQSTSDLAVDNLEVEALLSDDLITETDLYAGMWDYATVEIFMVNYNDLTMGKLYLRTGTLGEITIKRSTFVAELRGMMQSFTKHIGELYQPTCRADLFDARCHNNTLHDGPKAEDYTIKGTALSNGVLQTFPVLWNRDSEVLGDNYWGNTSLLLHMEGSNGGTSFIDSAEKSTVTSIGSVNTSTSFPKFGTSSAYFVNAGDTLIVPHIPDFDFGSDNFTIEGSFYLTTTGIAQSIISKRNSNSDYRYIMLNISTSNKLQLYVSNNGTLWSINGVTGTSTLSTSTWYTFALVRNNTSFNVYLNGTSDVSTSMSGGIYTLSTEPFTLGNGNSTGSGSQFKGYLDEVRITKGIARYTANYTIATTSFLNIQYSPATYGSNVPTDPIADNWFNGGLLTWLTGPNAGYSMEVKTWSSSGDISLVLPMPFAITVGDTFNVKRGCDKAFATCRDTFHNQLNFRGEPNLPGLDKLLVPGSYY